MRKSSIGTRHASCAQYSKMRPARISFATADSGYAPMRAPSAMRWLRSTVEIESSCTQPSRWIVASISALVPVRARGA